LCICPLLIFGSDQYQSLIAKTTSDRSITAFHLDELSLQEVNNILLLKLIALSPVQTVILFALPQCINDKHHRVLNRLIDLELIRFVVVDELHLTNHFGQSFRKEFPALRESLFERLNSTPILMMTATCTARICDSIQTMLGTTITSTHWPSGDEMKHRSFFFEAQYSTQPMSLVSKLIKPFITASDGFGNKVIIYANPAASIIRFDTGLEKIMNTDDDLCELDIVTVVGIMKREEKAENLRIFFNDSLQGDLKLKILCCTSGVANAGIDSPDIRAVYRIDFPPSILDLCQERGRAVKCGEE